MRRSHVLLLVALALCSQAFAGDKVGRAMKHWPSFRGPLHSGVAPHGDPPTEWSESKNIRWKVELPGPGHASPIVWGDRVYVLASIRTEEHVAPPEADTDAPESGSLGPARSSAQVLEASLQQAQKPPRRPEERRRRLHGARPRGRGGPARADEPTQLYRFVVVALERRSGKVIWQTVVREELPHEAGHLTASQASSSPVTDGKRIYAFFGSRGLYCLDRDGAIRWEQDFGDMQTRNEFGEGASPVLHGDTIVVNWDHEGDSFIVALDKHSGERRWKVARDEPTSWSTPLVIEDDGRALVLVSATNRVRAYDLKTGEEVWQCAGLGLNCVPTPVTDSGLVFVMSGYREAAGMAIRYAGARGDISDSDAVAWRIDRGTSYVPSPLLYDGTLYFLERFRGALSALDLKSGEPLYEPQRLEGLGNIYASPVGAAGRIYVLDRQGNAIVLRHGKTFEVLARNKLDDTFDATPAIARDELFLRGHKYLYNVAE